MQYINCIGEFRNVEDSECSSRITNPNLLNTSANDRHGLPIVRLKSLLHLVELITHFATR